MNKKYLLVKLFCFLLIATTVMTMFTTGCNSGVQNSKLGIEQHPDGKIRYNVKSKKNKFKLSEVALDFYYGLSHKAGGWENEDEENYEFVCFALYFYNGKYQHQALKEPSQA
jgi:hypothetical protein